MAQQHGDDDCCLKSIAHPYFDNTVSFLPYKDLPIFIQKVQQLGPPLGIILNKTKTKILTIPSSHSTASALMPSQNDNLQHAISLLNGTASVIHKNNVHMAFSMTPHQTHSSLLPLPSIPLINLQQRPLCNALAHLTPTISP
jgi:hypothetical protein